MRSAQTGLRPSWLFPCAWVLLALCWWGAGAAAAADGGAWVAPTSWEDSEGLWVDVPLAYDGSTASYAADQSNRVGNGPWLILDFAQPVHTDRTLVVADFGFDIVDAVSLEARVDGAWTPLFTGAIANDADAIVTFPAVTTDAIRFRFHYLTDGYYFWLYNFAAFGLPPTIVAPQVATTAPTAVTATTAALHGTVASDGGEPCAVRFVYRAIGSPTETATPWSGSIVSGQGSNAVLLPVTGLQSGVAYTYHCEARNHVGTAVGSEVTFTPQPVPLGSVEWLPASDVAPETANGMHWDDAVNALDDDQGTVARCYHPLWTDQWGPYLDLALPAVEIDYLRLSAGRNPYIDAVAVDIQQADGSWTPVYQGAFTDRVWQLCPLAAREIYPQARVRFHVTTTAVGTNWELFEVQVRMPNLVSFAAGADAIAAQTGHVDLPLRLQPATASVPITVNLATSGTAQATDRQFTSVTGNPPQIVIPAGSSSPSVGVDVLAGTGTGTLTAVFALSDAQYGRIGDPATATISIVRSPPPPPPTFTERRSPLHRLPVEAFDVARWTNDAAYRAAYLAATVPERVWETLPPTPGAPRLAVVGSARLHGTVGSVVTLTIAGVPGMPVNLCVDRPEVVIHGSASAWTVACDSNGSIAVLLTLIGAGEARIEIGSPVAVGEIHAQIVGAKP